MSTSTSSHGVNANATANANTNANAISRLPLALHLPQQSLPVGISPGASSSSSAPSYASANLNQQQQQQQENATGTGTAFQALVKNLTTQTDCEMVVTSLTNDNWRMRWERLCLRPIDEDDQDDEDEYDNNNHRDTQQWLDRERNRRETEREAEMWRRDGGFKRAELNVTRLEETERLIALASDWLELDSPDEGIRFDSELALRSELQLALHLGVPYLVIPPPLPENRENLPSYARAIASLLEIGGESALTRISIRIGVSDRPTPSSPLYSSTTSLSPSPNALSHHHHLQHQQQQHHHHHQQYQQQQGMSAEELKKHKRRSSMGPPGGLQRASGLNVAVQPHSGNYPTTAGGQGQGQGQAQAPNRQSILMTSGGDLNSFSWEVWDCIRSVCGYHPRLSLTLDLSNPLPPSLTTLGRWVSEPTSILFLPSQAFIPNAKGYPVLSKACQAFIKGFVRLKPIIVLSQTNTAKHPAGGPQAYNQYIRHLEASVLNSPTSIHNPMTAATGTIPKSQEMATYCDWLQAPLQPLMDDLGSMTYEVFEKDPVKYRQYEEAVYQALRDRPEQSTTVIYVVGAGRGPLVSGCLRAMSRSGRKARIYAVEKNPNAFVTLQEKQALEWGDSVKILLGDMRNIELPEPGDIMVSELLGSFGDNELSPECLDGVVRFLKPDGISIPASYTAHLAPLSSSKLFGQVQSQATKKGNSEEKAFETPYVVMFQQVNLLSGVPVAGEGSGRCGSRIQECWAFEHPRRDMMLDRHGLPLTNSHNTRSAHLTYRIPHAGALHGLAGYFEAHLYGDVGLSIHPEKMQYISPEMMSWFPLFFPFKEPLYLPSGAELEVHIWRLTDSKSRKVWYEWHAESFLPITGKINGLVSPPPNSGSIHGSRIVSNGSNVLSANSPMMDAPISPMPGGAFPGLNNTESRVKIGQTSLHNPGGRSSWIGL